MLLPAAAALLLSAWPNPNATRADLALPENWPNDPSYGYLEQTTCPGAAPDAGVDGGLVWRPKNGQWNLWGFYPPDTTDPCTPAAATPFSLAETLSPAERAAMHGPGMSADVAWTMTTGDRRVLIAVHDCGAKWSEPDLVNKWYLNAGELPVPQLADGGACASHDCNGDGVFNVQDYTSATGHEQPTIDKVTDPRISGYVCPQHPDCHGDTNGNGLLDPEDLIVIFSDGVDNDGNGFVDDISGWDFYWGDNDPYDDVGYGHGTGEAKDSAAEGNNGIGDIGVCPDCTVMAVRVGDSFVADADHFAEGVMYSLSQGASVIQEALGALNATPFMRQAIDAAYAHGAIVVASAADEDSVHHMWPGNAEHTLLVHAVEFDVSQEAASSFVLFNNCTNGGPHLVLSTPGTACSSEATGKSAGEAGLIYAAMLKFNPGAPPLAAGEVMQLMWMTAEDIDVPASLTDPTVYPAGPGWDLYFGYGRNDCGAAVAAVKAGQIPPVVDVTTPAWFETLDPAQVPTLTIAGHVSADRAPTYDFTVRVAPGVSPQPADFQLAASQSGLSKATDGTLATFSLKNLLPNPAETSTAPDAFTATVVVDAVAHYGGAIGDVKGTFRKSFFVHTDATLFKGFPIQLGTSGDSSPHFVDLNDAGHDTLVIATSDGRVHTFQPDGGELPGWPVAVQPLTDVAAHPAFPGYDAGPRQAVSSAAAVGSLRGDGQLQIVASTGDGQVYAWNVDGSLVPGFPVSADPAHFLDGTHDTTLADGTQVTYVLGRGFFAAPTLYDLAGDGKLEIIQPGEDGWVYVWDAAGKPYAGFPVSVYDPDGGLSGSQHLVEHARIMTTAAVGDINGDGKPEIVVGTNEVYGTADCRAYALWGDGNAHAGGPFLPGWPVNPRGLRNDILPDVGLGVPNAAALADLDGDGVLEVEVNGISAAPQFFKGDGTLLGQVDVSLAGSKAAFRDVPNYVPINNGAFGDVDGDGKVDFVDGTLGLHFLLGGLDGTSRVTPSHGVNAWSVARDYKASGVGFLSAPLPGMPAQANDLQFFMNYTIADIDGDGKNEIVSGSGIYLLTAYRADGTSPAGWPKNTGGWMTSTPAVGDFDGDGLLDVAEITREGNLFVWHGQGLASQKIEWEGYHHDARNTGNYSTPLAVRKGQPVASGCGCASAREGSGAAGLWGLAVAAALLARRRR